MNWLSRVSLLACAGVLGLVGHASAVLYFNPTENSYITFTHDPSDTSGTPYADDGQLAQPTGTLVGTGKLGTTDPLTVIPPPAAFGTNYQFKSTDTRPSSGGSSLATISASRVNNSTTLGIQVTAGTGVSQSN